MQPGSRGSQNQWQLKQQQPNLPPPEFFSLLLLFQPQKNSEVIYGLAITHDGRTDRQTDRVGKICGREKKEGKRMKKEKKTCLQLTSPTPSFFLLFFSGPTGISVTFRRASHRKIKLLTIQVSTYYPALIQSNLLASEGQSDIHYFKIIYEGAN